MFIVDKFSRGQQPVQTVTGAYPDGAGFILVDGFDVVITQAVRVLRFFCIVLKFLFFSVKLTNASTWSTKPERTGAILIDCPDNITAQAAGIQGVSFIGMKFLSVRVESVEPTPKRANP